MKLVINGSAVLRSSRGVRRYVDNVAKHLNWPNGTEQSPVYNSAAVDRFCELLQRGRRDTILWSPAQRGPLRAHHHVVTVHDCINVEWKYAHDWRLPALRWATQQLLTNAQFVVAISQATKAAVLRNYHVDPASLVVIESSCDVELGDAASSPEADKLCESTAPFILWVTNDLEHKNTMRTCAALIASRAAAYGVKVRVVGALASEALAACRQSPLEIEMHTGISDATLRNWYANCLFLLAPSLDEGHDLPVAEALAQQANVLCSNIPAHREFYDGLVETFEPTDSDAMTEALDNALDRNGRWLPGSLPDRSFADVAADYVRLFSSIR
jgi:glycosyltransferase involved in cell wall biosynthesis